MKRVKPLEPESLYRCCDIAQFPYNSTAELESEGGIIGQVRAVEAIRFGIGIEHEGYNLFALGPNGIGKHTAVNLFLDEKAPTEPTPPDWCYVNNFQQPPNPHTLQLPPGEGQTLSRDMNRFVEEILTVLPTALNSDESNAQKKAIINEIKGREAQAIKALEEEAKAHHIGIVNTPAGFAFAPLVEGEVISPEAFMKLSATEQKEIEAKIAELQNSLQMLMHQVPQWHRELQNKLKELQANVAGYALNPLIEELRKKYEEHENVLAYFDAVQEDILANVNELITSENEAAVDLSEATVKASSQKSLVNRYQVNVLIDNHETKGAPVIFEDQPTYQNLVGSVDHISHMGTLLTDFTLIKPGALHRANGGYLILDARKILVQPYAWEGLKRALRAQQVHIESLGQIYSWISTASLEPEPIPLAVKVILTGERELYYLLAHYDPDFSELFKVAVDFENDMEWNETNSQAYAELIANLARKENLRHFEMAAVGRIIEHSARLAGDASKLTAHMQRITDLLREADYWAGEAGHELVVLEDVQQALDAQIYRAGRLRERVRESVLRETILIDTDGEAVGQVNGLSVILLDQYAFGRPSRITARIRLGKGEVVDIERQAEMGGPLHSKGVMILAGFLGARYAAERPLPLSATLVFEQSYGGVDGDSASSAELYALLSALADVPLKQSLAVTGSVNQHGQIQAIGGVNEKIEGFYDLCQARGLTGTQGVLIPAANVKHLMLRSDVTDAACAGRFHIYPVANVDEGMALLTGMPAGEADAEGVFPENSINGRVVARLQALAEKAQAFASPPQANGQLNESQVVLE